jgi:hypothetical protein
MRVWISLIIRHVTEISRINWNFLEICGQIWYFARSYAPGLVNVFDEIRIYPIWHQIEGASYDKQRIRKPPL